MPVKCYNTYLRFPYIIDRQALVEVVINGHTNCSATYNCLCCVQRGWTAWTTAAVDKRVIGQMPVVMTLLNFFQVGDQVSLTAGLHERFTPDLSADSKDRLGKHPRETNLRRQFVVTIVSVELGMGPISSTVGSNFKAVAN